ncbi:hypothetical protein NX722_17180 [Endozoicomonas gorgoniicola]|uniref:N-acetyltransferase domain-containing protein n=1 Tax=Endozoicomonas gorgoniicola TaxID=1234144 RepID=A0ABT3MY76_9GAMM|nr:hypothetical protein [Endozoicomonas gorgoniicola]MCW7554320.1 hypothetical protein [Endozoicomonas gorgoniicola]
MPFHQIAIPEGSSFKHIPSDRTFILERSSSLNTLKLTLYHQEAHGLKTHAGFLDAISQPSGSCGRNYFEMSYTKVDIKYRKTGLATVLMFIIAREVQANGGIYLYINNPLKKYYGFYCQFGFYPAPESVKEQYTEILEDMRFMRRAKGLSVDEHIEIPFGDRITTMRGDYVLWRGAINPVLELLTKKLEGLYTFG